MKAVIFCGGQGTRIRDVNEVVPKPLVTIGERPILWHIMKIYSHYGVNEFILCLGYKGWKIKEYFLNYRAIINDFTIQVGHSGEVSFHSDTEEANWKVTLAETGENTMTGARLWRVRKYVEDQEHFCVTYGDGVANIDIGKLIEFHEKANVAGTITATRPTGRYGEMEIKNDMVNSFNEKPNYAEGWINGGFMVFNTKKVWDYFWPDDALVLEKESLPAMVKDHQLAVYKHEGFWLGMDTLREHSLLNAMWNSGKAPWKMWK